MSILRKFTDIMTSNINGILDEAQDPEKMVDQILRNLNADLGKVKGETASIMAEEATVKMELDSINAEINKMIDYAKRALSQGNDVGARAFLEKKASLNEQLDLLKSKYDIAKENSQKIRDMHNKISKEIDELSNRKNTTKAK